MTNSRSTHVASIVQGRTPPLVTGHWSLVIGVSLFVLSAFANRAAADVAAFEQAVQETIKKAEPSIACILISRSDQYKQFEQGQPASDKPGWLGDFPRIRPRDERDLDDPRQKLDMSSPDYVPESYGSGIVLDRSG